MVQTIPIKSLVIEGLQTRCALDVDAVNDYQDALKRGDHLPPVLVYREPSLPTSYSLLPTEKAAPRLFLADGFHRSAAAERAGFTEIEAEVRDGSFVDALRASLGANATHGLRRSNKDKAHALKMAWEHRTDLFGTDAPTDQQLAEMCAVSRQSAYNFRKALGEASPRKPRGKAVAREDRFGVTIPEPLLPAFRDMKLKNLVAALQGIRKEVEDEVTAENLAFAFVTQQIRIAVSNAYHDLKACEPYCVCRNCHGEGCTTCNNLGFQTEAQYNRLPAELKAEEV